MNGKVKTTDQLKLAFIQRDAGYSLSSIASNTGISPRTLSRHFKRLGTPKGELTSQVLNEAREQLLKDGSLVSDIKHQIAAAQLDSLSHIAELRSAIAITLDDLMQDKTISPMYRSRAIAALATSINLTETTIRKILQIDKQPIEESQLPTLYISKLTQGDIDKIRKDQFELNRLDFSDDNHQEDVVVEDY